MELLLLFFLIFILFYFILFFSASEAVVESVLTMLINQSFLVFMQIRDYRYICSQNGDNARVDKSPVMSKVALQMCMENVINDISSISDDSWTYSNLLVSRLGYQDFAVFFFLLCFEFTQLISCYY